MTRLEISAWSLAGGSACVFALAVVLAGLPWQAACAAVAVVVAAWAWRSRIMVGAAIGGIAWMSVTGFDVHRLGHIEVAGSDDLVRAAVLVVTGVLAATVHAKVDARRRYRRADPVWVDFHFHFHGSGLERADGGNRRSDRDRTPAALGETGSSRESNEGTERNG